MNYEAGDRVRATADFHIVLGTEVTGFHEQIILEEGHEGRIVAFTAIGIPVVQWDSGEYRIFLGYASSPSGLVYLDKGTTHLEAFLSGLHPDHIIPIDPSSVMNRPSSAETEMRAAQLRIHDEASTREVEAALANIKKRAPAQLPSEALQFGEVSKETVTNVPPHSYFCLNCTGWVLPKYTQQSKAVGAIALNTSGPITPVNMLTQLVDVAICSRCGAQVRVNAGNYAKELESERNHPTLARLRNLFR